jgi:chromosome segregation ATPase
VKQNKLKTEELKKQEGIKNKLSEELVENEKNLKELYNDIELKKNELSALARELTIKTNTVGYLKSELENKRKKLDEAKNEYGVKKDLLGKNEKQFGQAKDFEAAMDERNKELEKEVKKQRQLLEQNVGLLYDKSKELYKLREREANMIGEINNILSAKKNIKGNISKRDQEILKQQELLYNVDFQIQLMERKVAWVQGKRTKEETEELTTEIKSFENDIEKKTETLKKLKNSLKSIDEDLHNVKEKLAKSQEVKSKLTHAIEELQIENTKASQNVNKIIKYKEETLVQHDLMKLEIKKLHDRLVMEANQVFTEENKLYQLEISIKDREKEIQVHKEILVAEHKEAEEERHKAAMELSQKLIRANNLKLKYESLLQRNKKSGDNESDDVGEHSQAYYIIKTAQEKEELQRQRNFYIYFRGRNERKNKQMQKRPQIARIHD